MEALQQENHMWSCSNSLLLAAVEAVPTPHLCVRVFPASFSFLDSLTRATFPHFSSSILLRVSSFISASLALSTLQCPSLSSSNSIFLSVNCATLAGVGLVHIGGTFRLRIHLCYLVLLYFYVFHRLHFASFPTLAPCSTFQSCGFPLSADNFASLPPLCC